MNIKEFVLSTISQTLQIPKGEITENSRLADIAHDSIKLFELLIQFEHKLKTTVQYEDIVHIETIKDIIDYISSLDNLPPLEEITENY